LTGKGALSAQGKEFPCQGWSEFPTFARYIKKNMPTVEKSSVTQEFKLHDKDTGSADVQIALLTSRINDLTAHLQKFAKDHSSRRGLLRMVGQRRKLLDYLHTTDAPRYEKLIKKLNLRK
jgi:small subunit ribosomal protein S15